jgi:hypothetical protein
MSNDLFVRLSKYPPTKEMTPLENFFTELVGYLLDAESAACQDFLQVVLGNQAKDFRAQRVMTQQPTQSKSPNLTGLYPDLVLRSDKSELIVENKVDSKLGRDQLRNYLDYANERPDARVVVASRYHNEIVEDKEFKDDPRFLGEILWWEVADRWSKGKAYSNQFLVDSVLEFMEVREMGALKPYQIEEMAAPALWEEFFKKTNAILERLFKKIPQPDWAKAGKLKSEGPYADGEVGMHAYNGLLWYRPYSPAKGSAGESEFWYFVGFRYGGLEWLLPLQEKGEPECIAFVGVWWPENEKVRGFMVEEAKRLSTTLSAPAFQVGDSENRKGVFLFRRRQLKDFLDHTDQPAGILNFLEESHKKLEPVVPKIHERYRQAT